MHKTNTSEADDVKSPFKLLKQSHCYREDSKQPSSQNGSILRKRAKLK
jgi:hypothetical protein